MSMLAFLAVNDPLITCAMDVDSSFGPYAGGFLSSRDRKIQLMSDTEAHKEHVALCAFALKKGF